MASKEIKFRPNQLAVLSEAVSQSNSYTDKHLKEKFSNIQWLMVGVVVVCLIGFVQLTIDSFHVNSATYKEYSEKTNAIDLLQKNNELLLEQAKTNQSIILNQQDKILQLLKR